MTVTQPVVSPTTPAAGMTIRVCLVCREPLPSWARVDKTTCGPACRSRLSRTRKVSRNTFATLLRAVAPRSGGGESREPVGRQIAPLTASGDAAPASPSPMIPMITESGIGPVPRPANIVHPDRLIRVLAEGLRSIEERRAREQTERRNRAIIVPPKTEEPSDEPAPEP
jgi:predicted nucleic acid-binding Zn ribbon protein